MNTFLSTQMGRMLWVDRPYGGRPVVVRGSSSSDTGSEEVVKKQKKLPPVKRITRGTAYIMLVL